jgi:hypothetical protein
MSFVTGLFSRKKELSHFVNWIDDTGMRKLALIAKQSMEITECAVEDTLDILGPVFARTAEGSRRVLS